LLYIRTALPSPLQKEFIKSGRKSGSVDGLPFESKQEPPQDQSSDDSKAGNSAPQAELPELVLGLQAAKKTNGDFAVLGIWPGFSGRYEKLQKAATAGEQDLYWQQISKSDAYYFVVGVLKEMQRPFVEGLAAQSPKLLKMYASVDPLSWGKYGKVQRMVTQLGVHGTQSIKYHLRVPKLFS
jgi:hypothetical protein